MPLPFLRVLAFTAAAVALFPANALAQGPAAPPAQAPSLQPVQPAAQTPAQPDSQRTSAPPSAALPGAAPVAEAPLVRTLGAHTCIIADRGALDDVAARTAADVVLSELVKQKAPAGSYTIRLGQLGSRTRFVIASGSDEREAWLSSVDELPVAAARLVEALVTRQSVADTEKVSSVLDAEASAPRVKSGRLLFGASIIGQTTAGAATSVSTGVGLALLYRTTRYGLSVEGRATGIGSGDNKVSEVSLGIGGQLFLADTDLAPFVGAGMQLATYQLTSSPSSGSGLAAFGELGLAGFRSSKVGVFTSLRGAFPLFEVAPTKGYVVPVSLNLGLSFM
jgi:hypothetical protein